MSANAAAPSGGSGMGARPPPFVLSWLAAGGQGPPPFVTAGGSPPFAIPSVVTVVTTPSAVAPSVATSRPETDSSPSQSGQSSPVSPSPQVTGAIPSSSSQTPAVQSVFVTRTLETPAATSAASTNSDGLSTGAKAGIGVGVALGIILLVALGGLAWFFRVHKPRRERQKETAEADTGMVESAPEKKDDIKIQEMGSPPLVELDATEKPSELETPHTADPPKYTYERETGVPEERTEDKKPQEPQATEN